VALSKDPTRPAKAGFVVSGNLGEAYKTGVTLRHGFVHRALGVPKDDAEQFIDAAQLVRAYVADVMATVTLKRAGGES